MDPVGSVAIACKSVQWASTFVELPLWAVGTCPRACNRPPRLWSWGGGGGGRVGNDTQQSQQQFQRGANRAVLMRLIQARRGLAMSGSAIAVARPSRLAEV